jgi:hypothetical protein
MVVMRIIIINSCTIHLFTTEASTFRKSRDKADLKIAPSSDYDAKDPDIDSSAIYHLGDNQISSPLQNLLAAYLCPLGRVRNTNETGCFALFPNFATPPDNVAILSETRLQRPPRRTRQVSRKPVAEGIYGSWQGPIRLLQTALDMGTPCDLCETHAFKWKKSSEPGQW